MGFLFDGVYATFNNVSVISWRSVLLVEETRFTDKLYYIMLYISPWSRFELRPSVVIVICWQNRQMENCVKSREYHNLKKWLCFIQIYFHKKDCRWRCNWELNYRLNPGTHLCLSQVMMWISISIISWYFFVFNDLRWDVDARIVDMVLLLTVSIKHLRKNIIFRHVLIDDRPTVTSPNNFHIDHWLKITRMCVHGPLFVINQRAWLFSPGALFSSYSDIGAHGITDKLQ